MEKRALVNIVKKNINTFADFTHEFRLTSNITHTIKMRDAKPLRHKQRPI